jgi:hypothetical protein
VARRVREKLFSLIYDSDKDMGRGSEQLMTDSISKTPGARGLMLAHPAAGTRIDCS